MARLMLNHEFWSKLKTIMLQHGIYEAQSSREKKLKGWLRIKKITLIEEGNPGWDDLSLPWKI